MKKSTLRTSQKPREDKVEENKMILQEINFKLDQVLKLLRPKKHAEIVEEWLTEKEVQLLIGLKTTSLWKLRRLGRIKYSKIGQKVFYSKKSILRYFEKMEQ